MKVLLIDNYDSFTYNLVQILRELKVSFEVHKNDVLDIASIERFDKIILSPGPGLPEESGDLLKIIAVFASKKPLLGVCLGHQAIALHFGAELIQLPHVKHGIKSSLSIISPGILFRNIPNSISVGKYHSWQVSESNFPSCLQITARDENNGIMAYEHTSLPIYGVQFHPESIMTEYGDQIMANFLGIKNLTR